ncbi:sodium:calcium antiporter [Asticcacaulis benevestitus]|nr:sodium:calcium antiporter [Asticcacaulis benevestitus]
MVQIVGAVEMHFVQTYINQIYVVCGLVGLFLGGEGLIRGAVSIAERLNIPKLIVGLTIVGFGTSMPELLVCLQAVNRGAPDVALGNIIGSNTANILLIGGVGALIMPMSTQAKGLRRDVIVMLMAGVALLWFAFKGVITQQQGLVMAGLILVYLLLVLVLERKKTIPVEMEDIGAKHLSLPWAVTFVAGGLALLIFGADYLVKGSTAIASSMGVSEAVIGLTLVAVGTSLPEFTVSAMSAIKGQNEVSLGNIIGSNIFNILAILGITAGVYSLPVSAQFLSLDLPLMLGATLWLCVMVFAFKRIGRLSGLICLLLYAVYLTWLGLGAAGVQALGVSVLQSLKAFAGL